TNPLLVSGDDPGNPTPPPEIPELEEEPSLVFREWPHQLIHLVNTFHPELDVEESWEDWRDRFERSVNALDLAPDQKMEAAILMLRGSAASVVAECQLAGVPYKETMIAVNKWVQSLQQAVTTEGMSTDPSQPQPIKRREREIPKNEVLDGIVAELRNSQVGEWQPPTTTSEVVLFF
ncbi:MAG: hypothetical protein GY696_39770, partial [Gammaproteobacteria bacterium]|nr:hypothetical protein [Gammaproteobacteria bacterium]